MMTPKERYQNDPVFRQLVEVLRHYLEENACRQYTPTELREAVMLAASMYEFTHIRPIVMTPHGLFAGEYMGTWERSRCAVCREFITGEPHKCSISSKEPA